MIPEELVALAEMPASKEPSVGGKGTGMGRPQDQMPRIGQHRRLGLGRCTPEHIYNGAVLGIDSLQDGIRELLPAMVPVGIGLMRPDGQDRIEKEDALFRPGCQTAVIGDPASNIIMEFLIDIDQ